MPQQKAKFPASHRRSGSLLAGRGGVDPPVCEEIAAHWEGAPANASDCPIYRVVNGHPSPAGGGMSPEWLFGFLRSGRVDPAPTRERRFQRLAGAGSVMCRWDFLPDRSRENTAMKSGFSGVAQAFQFPPKPVGCRQSLRRVCPPVLFGFCDTSGSGTSERRSGGSASVSQRETKSNVGNPARS